MEGWGKEGKTSGIAPSTRYFTLSSKAYTMTGRDGRDIVWARERKDIKFHPQIKAVGKGAVENLSTNVFGNRLIKSVEVVRPEKVIDGARKKKGKPTQNYLKLGVPLGFWKKATELILTKDRQSPRSHHHPEEKVNLLNSRGAPKDKKGREAGRERKKPDYENDEKTQHN